MKNIYTTKNISLTGVALYAVVAKKSLPGPFLLTEHDVGYVYLDVGCLQCSDFFIVLSLLW